MPTPFMKRILLWLAAGTVFLGLAALIIQPRRLSVTVLNPKFHLLSAKLSYGKTHELASGNWAVTQLAKLLHFVDARVDVPIRLPSTTEDTYALAVRFTGDFAPNELGGVQAELVDASGGVTLPRCWAGYDSENSRNGWERGQLWLLDSPLTHPVTLRLKTAIGQAPLAEIRIGVDSSGHFMGD